MFVLARPAPETAATRVVPRRLAADIPVERTYLNPETYPDLSAMVPASGPAGSVLVCRPDVYHRGVRMTAPRRHVSCCTSPTSRRPPTGWDPSDCPNAGEDLSWYRFVDRASERQLTVLGFPPPGPAYWNARDAGRGGRPVPDARSLALARCGAPTPRRRRRGSCRRPVVEVGVLYQVYPRSFADSDGDGNGDLRGSSAPGPPFLAGGGRRLAKPVTLSPNADWGYDVTDFCAVQPEFGTLDDFDQLVAEASRGTSASSWTWCRTTPAISIRGSSTPGRLRTSGSGTGTCGPIPRRTARRPTTGSAASAARRGRSTRQSGQYYMHNHLGPNSRTSTGGTKRSGGLRRDLPVLVRPWRGRLPDRRVQRHHQGRRAPGQPAGHRGRRLRGTDVRSAQRLQRQPSGGPRGDPALATLADTYHPPRILLGETPVPMDQLPPYYGTAATSSSGLQLPPSSTCRSRQTPW